MKGYHNSLTARLLALLLAVLLTASMLPGTVNAEEATS